MEKILMVFAMNLPSIVAISFAGYIIATKGYIGGTGWLIFAGIVLCVNSYKG